MSLNRYCLRLMCCRIDNVNRILIPCAAIFSLLILWQTYHDSQHSAVERFVVLKRLFTKHKHTSHITGLNDYIEIPDVEVPEVNFSDLNITGSHEGPLTACKKMGKECLGLFISGKGSREVINALKSVEMIRIGTNTLYIKSEFISLLRFESVQCAVPLKQAVIDGSEKGGCKLPNLNPFDSSVTKYMDKMEPLQCDGTLYTEYKGNVLRLLKTAGGGEEITYSPILRPEDSDDGCEYGTETTLSEAKEVKLTHDFIRVNIKKKGNSYQTDFHAQVVPKPSVLTRARSSSGIPLNIVILGMDGNSEANVQRLLPDAYNFLKDELNGFMFKGFSVVGEATTPQLTAMLTGKTLQENCKTHEGRKGYENSGTLDNWPFIFKTLAEHGYATMFSEDAPEIGAFSLRLNGFQKQPCDHYGRYFWFAVPYNDLGTHDNCLGAQAQHNIQLQYLKSMFTAYPQTPKFGFTFLGSLCHKTLNTVSVAAKDIHNFLKSLKEEGHLNNTMLVVMGDHGARFDEIRSTLQGKLEERLPFLSIVLPKWFKEEYVAFTNNLKRNTQRIISPLDLHATFMHILKYPKDPSRSELTMGVSLFEEIPRQRDCQDAFIPEHFCPCILWKPISSEHAHVKIIAELAVDLINKKLKDVMSFCHSLKLKSIRSAVQQMVNKKVQSFASIEDGMGLGIGKPVFDSDYKATQCSYQIQFQTSPGNALFEASVKMMDDKFVVLGDISRVNRYGSQADCIKAKYPFLRRFCFCKTSKQIVQQTK